MNEFLLGLGFINIGSIKEILPIISVILVVFVFLGTYLLIKSLIKRKVK